MRDEYRSRFAAREAAASAEHRRHILYGNLRLAIAAGAAALAWLAVGRGAISGWSLLLPVAAFVVLAMAHERVLRRKALHQRAAAWYRRGLDRLDDRWAGVGEPGDRFGDPEHPYAADLDLFGEGSLFQLLCAARTSAGEAALARWLKEPAAAAEILERQQAVDELRPNLDLREDLAVLGEDVRAGVHPEPLAVWGEGAALLDSPARRALCVVLATATVASIAASLLIDSWLPFAIVGGIQGVFAYRLRPTVLRVLQSLEHPAHDLAILAEVLTRLERESFRCPRLASLRAALDAAGEPPSVQIGRLRRIVELVDSRDNVAVRAFGPLVLWGTQLAFAVEAWRKRSGPAVRRWLDAVGEIEALSSLAGYAAEHPHDPFPQLLGAPARYRGEALGHPLLPDSRFVRNSVELGPAAPLLVVSGSNMSGKSTMLRTVGINAVLAMAGAPVRAHSLALTPLDIGASIRVLDSLQGGKSRFFTEITRLRQFVAMAGGDRPVLYLLDEVLHGTNSHDRRIGAEAVVRALAARGGIGMITTHDLALAEIASALNPPGVNVHFEDRFEDGRMTFDYQMRPGVVARSNALELMRSVGLDV